MHVSASPDPTFGVDIWVSGTPETPGYGAVLERHGGILTPEGYVTEPRVAGAVALELAALGCAILVDGEPAGPLAPL